MIKLGMQGIRDLARSIVASKPGGIRYAQLVDEISQKSPETSKHTIQGSVWNLHTIFPQEIAKPNRGLFMPAGNSVDESAEDGSTEQILQTGIKVKESEFYEPFADWLKNELDEVNSAVPLGRAGLKSKWGTPDVVGVYKPKASDFIKFPIEIVSAEIKIDPKASVVAFGQAVAYRLFSTKVYIVMPNTLTEDDKARMESLCILFGVGFVIFELNKNAPIFKIRVSAQRFSPDMFYVNEFAERLNRHDGEVFQELFG